MQIKGWIILSLAFAMGWGCVKRADVRPEAVPLEKLAAKETSPTRAASMRLVLKGRNELDRGKIERAAHFITQAIELDAQNPFAYFYLGLARFQTGRFQQSSELFFRAGELFGHDVSWKAESFARQGESLEKQNKLTLARAAFLQGVRLDAFNERAVEGMERMQKRTHE